MKGSALMFAVYALLLTFVGGCITGGGLAKCPPNAVCGYVAIDGKTFYLCGDPSQFQGAKLAASELQRKAYR